MNIRITAKEACKRGIKLTAIGIAAWASLGAASGYHLLAKIAIPGSGGWDYLTVDDAARRVYVSHATRVEVLDADRHRLVGSIPGTLGVHGIALAREFGRGFITAGKANSVLVFDLASLKTTRVLTTGDDPDAIVYDAATKRVFVMNGKSSTASVFDAADLSSAGTIDLGGGPEFSVADGHGSVYVNLEDQNQLLRIDSRALRISNRWSVAPCQAPSSLAMDGQNRRLFVGCRSHVMAVVDAETGNVVATAPIGDHVDASAFDPATKLIYYSTGEGNVAIFHEDTPDRYTFLENVSTNKGSKTMALDLATHRLFVPANDSGNFEILVFGNQ